MIEAYLKLGPDDFDSLLVLFIALKDFNQWICSHSFCFYSKILDSCCGDLLAESANRILMALPFRIENLRIPFRGPN